MSTVEKRGRLLVFASRSALQEAAQLVPRGRCLEVLVEDAIRSGRKSERTLPGIAPLHPNERLVYLDGDVVARVERSVSPLGRKCWRVSTVRRVPRERPR